MGDLSGLESAGRRARFHNVRIRPAKTRVKLDWETVRVKSGDDSRISSFSRSPGDKASRGGVMIEMSDENEDSHALTNVAAR
jgi:hypothetical protein